MARGFVIVVLAVVCGCGGPSSTTTAPSPAAQEPRQSAARHGRVLRQVAQGPRPRDVVVDAEGVGVGNNATRLRRRIYESKRQETGGFVVEVEFAVQLPSRREIVEFVAGMGETEQQAINDALVNFTLTTSHAVYKAFINPADPHMTSKAMTINGANREVILGDILMRGGDSEKDLDLNPMRASIQGVLSDEPLTPVPHWIKVVYSQNEGKPMTVAVTLDNADHPGMTDAVTRLNWPRRNGFYMAKQFIVVK